jgi:hypothetical protein
MELVFPQSNFLWSLRLWFALYLGIVLVGAAVFGDRWIARCDPFEAYSNLVAHLSFFGRRGDGSLVWRSPLRNLDGLPAVPGLVAVVSVLAGSTAFDSFKESLAWLRVAKEIPLPSVWLNTLALAVFCLVVGLLFSAATMAAPPIGGVSRRAMPALFAHSIVPIIVGYVVAHYLSFFVEIGQQTVIYLSDPMVNGSNLLGTADWQVSYWVSLHPTLLAVVKVGSIITGHVLGVIAAHDRAMKLLPRRHLLTGQLPLLVLMVGFTCGGLYLLLTV